MHLRLTTALVLTLGACTTTEPLPPELPSPEVPETIAVPEGHRLSFVGHAEGVQIYECAGDNSAALAWRLRAPRAALTAADGSLLATHFGGVDVGSPAGPYWRSVVDGSSVHGGNPVSSPNPGSIALLRLDAVDTAGRGIFSDVTFIHRLATEGGVGPTGACATANARTEVPYAADYYFYVAL
jgi:Protein of unknown function (DUF3455)